MYVRINTYYWNERYFTKYIFILCYEMSLLSSRFSGPDLSKSGRKRIYLIF